MDKKILKFLQKEIALATLILAGFLFLVPFAKALSLHSSFFDLGIFESLLHRIASTSEWQSAFSGHAHWFALPFGWLYGLPPPSLAPYFLVSMQAILLLLPALWFYRRFGVFSAFVYVAYYPVWVNAHFDFHFDHLAVPLLLGFYWALLDRRIGWAVLSATLLIFLKEPFALQTAACGVLLLWVAVHRKSIWEQPSDLVSQRSLLLGAVWLIGVGLGYLVLVTHYLIPYFSIDGWHGSLESGAFGWLGSSFGEMILTIVTRPHVIIWDIITTPSKLIYLVMIFGLIAFISLLRPAFLIPTIPLLAIAMLSRLSNYYDYNTHYTAGLIVPVMFAFMYGLPRAERIWERLVLRIKGMLQYLRDFPAFTSLLASCRGERCVFVREGDKREGLFGRSGIGFSTVEARRRLFYVLLFGWILFGHIMMSPSPTSRLFWSDKVWSYSWRAYVPTGREAMMKAAMLEHIPVDREVSVTTQNAVNWSHLAHRKVYLPFPLGIAEPHKVMDWSNRTWNGLGVFVRTEYKPLTITHDRYADYVVLDLKRPYFLIDRGCGWIYGECWDKEMEKKFLGWVSYTRSLYETVFERDGFMILRRGGV